MAPLTRSDHHSIGIACLALAATALGQAVQIADGFYHPGALVVVALSLALTLVGVWFMPGRIENAAAAADMRPRPGVALLVVLAIGILSQVVALLTKSPGIYLRADARIVWFHGGVVAQAVVISVGALGTMATLGAFGTGRARGLGRVWFPAVLVLSLALGGWMLRASPDPQIDVVEVHESALRALGRGRNPYRITFRNIYGDARFYNPEAVAGNRVMFGYPYPPLSLLLAAPGQLAFKDYRYAQLAAAVGAAALMGYAGGSLVSKLAAVLWLTTPRLYFVLEQGWTEPIAVLMLAFTTFCLLRKPTWSPWTAGLLVVTKQYVALAAPLLWRYASARPGGARPFTTRALIAGSIVTLPFLVWNVQAFLDTVVLLQTKEPFRIDSLSFVSWAARGGWGEASWVWAVAGGVAALVMAIWRSPNTVGGFCGGVALASLGFFALGSKAFCNYYVFVIGALCCAVAACAAERHPTARDIALTIAPDTA